MPLECFKSLNKIQTENKKSNGNHRDKLKMFYTEVYNISPREQRNHTSKIHRESRSARFSSEKLSEILNLLNEKIDENKTRSTNQKTKPDLHKQIHDSHSYSYKIQSRPRKQNTTLTREIPFKKRNFIVKQIPLNKDLEFSIDRNQCPMKVRIHKGNINKLRKKQELEKTNFLPISHSHSCPPRIEDRNKVTSESKDNSHKEKQQRSKCKLLSHGYTIAELLNLSPRKSERKPTKNNVNSNTNISKQENPNSRIIKKNKKQNSQCVNERIHNCTDNNIRYQIKKYPTNRSRMKSQKVSLREKSKEQNLKSDRWKLEDDKDFDKHNQTDACINGQYNTNNYYCSLKKVRDLNSTEHDCDKDKASQRKQTSLTGKSSINPKNQIDRHKKKCMVQNQTSVEIPYDRRLDCHCKRCKNENINKRRKKLTHSIVSEFSADIPETLKDVNKEIYNTQECFMLEKVFTKDGFKPENVVILDASQSQYHKISTFLKNKTSEYKSLENLNLSSSTHINGLVNDDYQDYSNNSTIIKNNIFKACGKTRKVRSEEKYLNKYIDNKTPEPLIDPLKYNSSLPNVSNNSHNKFSNIFDHEKIKNNNIHSLNYYKCLRCNKSVSEISNFGSFCSDCYLKAKLSQISKESLHTNPDSKVKEPLVPFTNVLTTIPESDMSISKQLVNVAIQTDCDYSENNTQALNKNINNNPAENTNNTSLSLDNVIHIYCDMVSQLEKFQGLKYCNVKENLTKQDANLQIDQNITWSGREDMEMNVKELRRNSSVRELSSTKDHGWSMFNPEEPNIHINRSRTTENCLLDYQFKVSEPVTHFVSPIFPEKEYHRITSNKLNAYLATKSSNETVKSKTAVKSSSYFSQEYLKKLSDNNFQSKSVEEYPDCCIQSETSHGKYINSFEGPSNSYDLLKKSSKEQLIVKNNKPSIGEIRSERDKDTLHNFLDPAINIRDPVVLLDENSTNKSSQEKHSTGTKNFQSAKKDKDFNYIPLHQPLKFHNSNMCLEGFQNTVSNEKSVNDLQTQGLFSNQGKNCLYDGMFKEVNARNEDTISVQKECSLESESPDITDYKPLNNSNSTQCLQFERTVDPAEDKINANHREKGDQADSLAVLDPKMMEKYEISKCVTGIGDTNDIFEQHTFSYIFFNISIPGEEYDNPGNEESNEMKDSQQTGLVLMPERAIDARDNKFNDILLGSVCKTQINSRLMLKDTNGYELNVFELKSASKLSNIAGDGESEQNYTKGNLENPLMFDVINQNTDIKDLNDSILQDKINHPTALVVQNASLTEQQLEMYKKPRNIYNKSLKKRKYVNAIGKKLNAKKIREGRCKYFKVNNLFVNSYITKIPLFRFLGGLQRINVFRV